MGQALLTRLVSPPSRLAAVIRAKAAAVAT